MSLLLCRQEAVSRPYYVEPLDIHLYSSQELCYVIVHHPLLVMEDFVDERLIGFIRDELNMGRLAGKLEKWKAAGENPDEMLFFILWSVVGMLTYDTRILVVMLLFSLVVFKVSKTEWKQVGTVFKFILLFLCMNIVIVYLFSPYEGCTIYGTRTELFHIAGRYLSLTHI